MTSASVADDHLRELAGLTAADVLAQEGFSADGDIPVYLSGSVLAGHANPWSDVDVYAVTDREPSGPHAQRAATNHTSQHLAGGRRFDWELWRTADVHALAARVDALEPGSGGEILGTAFLHIEECFVHRLRIGLPIACADGFEALRARFDFARFAAFQAAEAIRWLDAYMEDLSGMLEAGDCDVALLTAREVVGAAVDAYCHHRGSTDPVRKWRAKHLAALAEAEIEAGFWRLQLPPPEVRGDPAAVAHHCAESIRFAERLAASVQG